MIRLSLLTAVFAGFSCVGLLAQTSQPPVLSRGEREGSPPQEQSAASQPNPDTSQRGTETAPVVVRIQPPEDAEQRAAQDEADRKDEAAARWWGVWLSGLLTLVALGTGIVVGWQAWEARKSANAARISADFAEEQLRNLRPYVQTGSWKIQVFPWIKDRNKLAVQAHFRLRNHGATLAEILRIEWKAVVVTWGGQEPTVVRKSGTLSRFDLPPRLSRTRYLDFGWFGDEIRPKSQAGAAWPTLTLYVAIKYKGTGTNADEWVEEAMVAGQCFDGAVPAPMPGEFGPEALDYLVIDGKNYHDPARQKHAQPSGHEPG
jgi:hypothetical protein